LAVDPRMFEGLADFRRAIRQFLAFSEAATQAAGITPQQYQALLVIKTSPDGVVGIGELADHLMLQPHGAVQLADRLVRSDLAVRHQSESDRRRVLVAITENGTQVLERLVENHAKELLKHEPLLAESLRRLRQISRI
jgi:DNA-binding MarR family transcriptional regulator